MARTFTYLGEAEQVVPFTLDGPRVVSAGDQIRLADGDTSFDEHPLWEAGSPPPPPAVTTTDPAVPDPAPAAPEDSDPETPGTQEPTA